jgi:proteasome lid subunit RPN8/RPN11
MTDQPESIPTDDISLPSPSEEPSPAVSAPPRVFLSASALEGIRAHGYTDTAHECGGVMVGSKLDGGDGPVVLVEAVIAGAHTDNRRGSVTFTHETWEHINQEKDQKYSDLRIVGWYHTHPGFGIFLSDYDQFIHANFFNLPWNVAFVLDPLSGESGAFGWVEGKITRLPEYESYAVADEHPPLGAQASQPASDAVAEPAPQPVAFEPPEPPPPARRGVSWSVVVALLGVLLMLGLIAAWALGIWVMGHKAPPAALPSTMKVTPIPIPTTPPPPVANALAPAPPGEATPPPATSNSASAADKVLHEPAPTNTTGP